MELEARRLDGPAPGAEHYRLVLPTDLARVHEAIDRIVACCRGPHRLSRTAQFRLCTVAAEAITNAMSYGNRGNRALRVTVELQLRPESLVLSVSDEGDGFDPDAVSTLSDADCHSATRGRGLFIIRKFASQVAFNERGNTIWVTLPRA